MDKQEFLSRAHDRAVLNAIHQASIDIRQINKKETSEKKQSLETRIENIEKRLNVLEDKEKFSKKN
ncbi:MAG: hypothetical protein LBI18_08475 [Planctomycetaceae bacterium]|jgi:chaperonin cofactor prefoldin|nr:hypothetical protein [Planctomycetaceae bacterium]